MGFWLKRFALAFLGAGALLLAVEMLKGHAADQAVPFALGWGAMFATVFTLVGYARFRRNPACMLPRDRRH